MKSLLKYALIIIISIVLSVFNKIVPPSNCKLPSGCQIVKWLEIGDPEANQIFLKSKFLGMKCNIQNEHYRFDFDSSSFADNKSNHGTWIWNATCH